MVTVSNNDRPGLAALGRINKFASFTCFLAHSFNR
jgi:hypothetical protein